jgi:hypothetical protein
MFKQVSIVVILPRYVCLLTEDRSEAGISIWGQTKFEIIKRCRRKKKLLPSSTYCSKFDNHVWTNVFRVEEDLEIKTGK